MGVSKDDDRVDNKGKKKLHHKASSSRLKRPARSVTYYKGDFQLTRSIIEGDPYKGWWVIWHKEGPLLKFVEAWWKKEDALKVWDSLETPPPLDLAESHDKVANLKREHAEIQMIQSIEFWSESSLHRK